MSRTETLASKEKSRGRENAKVQETFIPHPGVLYGLDFSKCSNSSHELYFWWRITEGSNLPGSLAVH
jgi:hypothetical protein